MLMKYLVILIKEKSMISMVKMLLKKEWEVVVLHIVHLIYLNRSLEEVLAVRYGLLISIIDFVILWTFFIIWLKNIDITCPYDLVGGGSSRGRRQKQGEDVVHTLKVSLEDLYNGTSKKLSLSREILCPKCKGYVVNLIVSCNLLAFNSVDIK